MSRWKTLTFDVLNPEQRLQQVESQLDIEYYVAVVDGVIGVYAPGISHSTASTTELMRLFLRPGEYAAIMTLSDTTDTGSGEVYQMQSDGDLERVDTFYETGSAAPAKGRKVRKWVYKRYDFSPFVDYPSEMTERWSAGTRR